LISFAHSKDPHSLAKMVETLRLERDMTENRAERDQDQAIGVEAAKDGGQATAKLTDNRKDGDEGDEKAAALSSSSGSKADKVQTGKKEEKPKPSKFKEIWEKAGLDVGTCLMMFK
jgi:hypothetical protein